MRNQARTERSPDAVCLLMEDSQANVAAEEKDTASELDVTRCVFLGKQEEAVKGSE